MEAIRLRHALRADLDAVVAIWVDAFAADPYFRWIAASDDAYGAFAADWLAMIAGLAFERGHTYLDPAVTVAVAWIPPDLSLVSPADLERVRGIIAHHAGAARADEAFATIVAARAHAIEEPHWTLQYIGVRAVAQGRAVGAAAVAPVLRRIDDDGLPCGLVSSNPRNFSFYQRLGFEVAATVATPDGAVALRPMRRAAGSSA